MHAINFAYTRNTLQCQDDTSEGVVIFREASGGESVQRHRRTRQTGIQHPEAYKAKRRKNRRIE